MAIFSKLMIGACAVAALVQAAPVVVTVTDFVTVTTWETVYGTLTVWPTDNNTTTTTTTTISTASSSSIASTTSDVPAIQIPTTPAVAALPQTPATPVTTSAYSSPAVFVQQPATTPAVQAASVPTNNIARQQTTTLATSAVAIVQSIPAPATDSSTGGTCSGAGNACTGDVTHWDGGLGACGWTVNTDSDMQIALPVGLMGSQSNGNPYCGKSVSIISTSGAIIKATVGDKCMGCSGDAIDLTNALFNAVTDGTGNGRVHGIRWYFS